MLIKNLKHQPNETFSQLAARVNQCFLVVDPKQKRKYERIASFIEAIDGKISHDLFVMDPKTMEEAIKAAERLQQKEKDTERVENKLVFYSRRNNRYKVKRKKYRNRNCYRNKYKRRRVNNNNNWKYYNKKRKESNLCYRCNKPGHTAVNCFAPKCSACKQVGHMKANCRKNWIATLAIRTANVARF